MTIDDYTLRTVQGSTGILTYAADLCMCTLCNQYSICTFADVGILWLDCNVAYAIANLAIMPESHNNWIQILETDLDDTFQDCVTSFSVIYFCWTPQNLILWFQDCLVARKMMLTDSIRCLKSEQWILHLQAQQQVVVSPTKSKDLHGWALCADGFIWDVKWIDTNYIVPVRAIVGHADLMQENVALDWMDIVWLVNNHMDSDTHRIL